jgi:fructosamine-3-kinase
VRWVGGDLPEIVGGMVGSSPIASGRIGGGDINDAYKMRFANGTTVFVKTRVDAPPGFYRAEAEGLRWLRETNTVTVPEVVGVRDDPELAHRFLVLEWIEPGPPAADHDEQLGRALAELHRFPCPRFGADADGWLATVPLDNRPAPTWADFYGARRLEPLVRASVDRGLLPTADATRFGTLLDRLPELLGPLTIADPGPHRVHGDLWAGNVIIGAGGSPVLVDPAAYGGHREVDLAMMALFGGFGPTVVHAYDEVHPRAVDHERRRSLHQLLPLLVHLLLFGGSYATGVRRALTEYVP